MKSISLYLCAVLCTLGLMTSCDYGVMPDAISGTYKGTMDIDFNLSMVEDYDIEIPYEAVVTKVDEAYVEIALDLNLTKYLNPTLVTLVGSSLDFGVVTARCLVGPTMRGETPLTGSATVGGKSVLVHGDFENGVLDITYVLGVVSVEFEGIRQ